MYFKLNKSKNNPIYIQLYEAISSEIACGRLPNGSKLTPRRTLAQELGISQNTVESAYKMLQDTGYVKTIPRQGYVVSFKSSALGNDLPWETNAPERVVFSPNGIDTSQINFTAYAKILRNVAYNNGEDIFSYVDKSGEFVLRSAIAQYLYSFRNIKTSPDKILIGAGAEYLLTSLAAIFDNPVFIFENPCDTHFYNALAVYNHNIALLNSNGGKFNIDALSDCSGNILFVEPDTRFPHCSAMDLQTRTSILNWANQSNDRYIIELGYDSELQWESHETLYSMDTNNKVIYLNTFSRSLGPGIKTSYMVLPEELLDLWKKKHVYYYSLTSKADQYALAEFINKGHFTKHYKSMRAFYKEKFNYTRAYIQELFGDDFEIINNSAGTYFTFKLKGYSALELKKHSRRCGVKILSLNSYNVTDIPLTNDYLILGTGDLEKSEIKLGLQLLKENPALINIRATQTELKAKK